MRKVVFVCTHNSGRSQMAEAFAEKLGKGKIVAESAGTAPGSVLNPRVVEAMEEIGYDMSGRHPKLMTTEMIGTADRVITMGCGVNLDDIEHEGAVCPAVFVESEDWGLDDPIDQPIDKVREIRDEIRTRVEALVKQMTEADTDG